MKKVLGPLVAVIALVVIGWIGGSIKPLQVVFGGLLPILAFLSFIFFFIKKVMDWGKSPVPFRIPTTCGQEKSLPWIKQNKIDNPSSMGGVLVRMFLEIFLFRSLFRNTKAEINDGPQLAYGSSKYLWLFGLLFHYSFLVIFLRHFRLFREPIPQFVHGLEFFDGILQVGVPALYVSDLVFVGAITFLFLRRLINAQVRYVSLPADYFPLFLLLGIGITGILMRYFIRVDIVNVKQFVLSMTAFMPKNPGSIGSIFFIHVFLVSVLMAYFPFSKLMHFAGVFMSPTRNLANNSRMVRHENPWNDPNIKPHSYAGYEDEFREFMVGAGLPVDKELPPAPEEPAESEEASAE